MAPLHYTAKCDPFLSLDCAPRPPPGQAQSKEWKGSNFAIWQPWIQAMKRHPWRTSNPHEAMLAILPISLDHKKLHPMGCPRLKDDTIVEEVEKVLQSSSIFPAIRHVFIAQDYRTKRLAKRIFSLLQPAGIWSHNEGRGDCKTSLPYNTNYATFMTMRSPNGWHLPNPGMVARWR